MFRTIAASLLLEADAFKSYVMKNSQVIGGQNSQLLEIDMDTKVERIVNNDIDANMNFVKGSVVCGNTWYGIGSQFQSGPNVIAQVDLSTGQLAVTEVHGLFYQLKCGDNAEELYAVVAVSSPPIFALVKQILGESPRTDVIAQFPEVLWGGWVSIFTFSGNELQANFPVKSRSQSSAKGGEVYRMDITTGNITMHKQYKGGFLKSAGVPYFVKHTEGSMTATGIFSKEQGSEDLKLCNVDYSGSEASVSECKTLSKDWWSTGALPVQCSNDGLHYSPSKGGRQAGYEPINGYNMEAGDFQEVFQVEGDFEGMEARWNLGTHTCVSSAQVV